MDLIVATKLFADPTGHYSRPDLMSLNVCTRVKKMIREEEIEPLERVGDDLSDEK
jgi:hypothetical protein